MFVNQSMIRISQMDRPAAYHRSLTFLAMKLDPIQYRKVWHDEIATGTGLSRPSVERAMKMLSQDRVIFTAEKGCKKVYRLNNNLFWASTAEKFNQAATDPEVIDARGR